MDGSIPPAAARPIRQLAIGGAKAPHRDVTHATERCEPA
jgi:hypothetical protein